MNIALPQGWRLDARDRVGSTNDEARALAVAGAPHGTIVWARRQDAARGRRGRAWSSPEGNLACSAILRPDIPFARAGELTFVVGVALADAVAGFGVEPKLKWPNDVQIAGDKLAGILLEAAVATDRSVDWIVAGTGVNIAHHPQLADYHATSLHAAGARDATVEAVLERYTAALDRRLAEWREEGFDATRAAWLGRAVGLGARIKVRLETETLEGVFEHIDPSGALILRTDTGRHSITAGDVFFGRG
ncbi:biotin--[acetyl-CoA-carboxylase] ligase [Inquilinus sp. Marseille-Q2685]|uniref:biotin--[acetyl-CoA-carboxylase] ligase n=1 Tax=Inquilinus sp. Marseille-Q2685 TaxID=2866581 RepID=UPI001CE4074B|nr:biotin--[acetyl-CoA-carboxylase] ligase [Inquilinus sp. Marseille-Q2685]